MKIVVIGTGYVGLVTGTCFAEVGYHVTCVDNDQAKIDKLNQGICPIFEPGLEEKMRRNLHERRLTFTTDYVGGDVVFLTLPTPSQEDGSCDLSHVEASTKKLGPLLSPNSIVVSKSTVPVGTAQKIKQWLGGCRIASNPEFLKQGDAVNDFMKPDRIIIGVEDEATGQLMKKLYSPFSVSHDRILIMDIASSEMAKYAANAMLAARISLMNELAALCEKTGADIGAVRLGIGSDRRIGYPFLYAGLGFGGSCFPKDLLALEAMGHEHNSPMHILEAVREVNDRQREHFVEKILAYFDGDLRGKTLGILGLSFKPETDDMRNAPSLYLIDALLNAGARVHLYDPAAMPKAKELIHDVAWASDEEACAQGADALVLVTEWKQFRQLDFEQLGNRMKNRILFDGRNQYNRQEMSEFGFTYISVGRPSANLVTA